MRKSFSGKNLTAESVNILPAAFALSLSPLGSGYEIKYFYENLDFLYIFFFFFLYYREKRKQKEKEIRFAYFVLAFFFCFFLSGGDYLFVFILGREIEIDDSVVKELSFFHGTEENEV